MIPPYDAWAYGRALCGLYLNGEMQAVSGPFKGIIGHLNSLPPDARQAASAAFVASRTDGEEIVKAISNVDPEAPPPEESDDGLPPDEEVITVCLGDVQEVEVEWLWQDRVPRSKVTLFAGEAKQGKSFLTMWLSAAVSAGLEVPGGGGLCMPRGSVVLLSAEDDLADTIKPRLIAAGADFNKIHALTTLKLSNGKFERFTLSYLPHLERGIARFRDTRLVVIDPITSFIGAGIDDHKAAQLRSLIDPLKDLAARWRVAIVIIAHLNKSGGTKALARVSGSNAYTALARANWLICKDPEDPKRRLFLSAGTNLTEEPSGLAYRINKQERRIEWEDTPVLITADQALTAEREHTRADDRVPKGVQAKEWLKAIFKANVPLPSESILVIGEAMGLKRDALFAAKKALGIAAKKSREFGGAWFWHPPGTDGESTLRQFDPETEDADQKLF